MPSCLSHGSLFSGIGGFDLAAQWNGWNNVFQCEKDEWCRKVLAKNFPTTKRFEDIKEFNAKEYNGTIDIISGGFPCQPFSVAGQRKGKEDDRYLWAEMLRIINEVQPQYIVGENVTGIIGMALDTVLSDLEAQGYSTETYIIPACSKNAWHRRDRVWIVAYANCIRRNNEQKENGQLVHNGEWNGTIEEQSRREQQCRIGEPGSILSDTTSKRQQGQGKCIKWGSNSEEEERETNNVVSNSINSQWAVEPELGRVANGIPNRLDRLKGLGNAIVPQVAYEIFRSIGELHRHGA